MRSKCKGPKQSLHLSRECRPNFCELSDPLRRLQLICRYGLYASRTKGRWTDMPWFAERASEGWKATHRSTSNQDDPFYEPLSEAEQEVAPDARKRACACLLAKVYQVDPRVCPKCGAEMKMIAIIKDPDQIKRILRHLVKIGRSPPGFESDRLN